MASASEVSTLLKQNLERVEARIEAACRQAGRTRNEITLIGITKYVDAATTKLLFEAGLHKLGESRPQIIWEKATQILEARWHLVGHLQRNKVTRTLPLVSLIHSVDSQRLLHAINEEAAKINKVQEVLLELHLTAEQTKSGFTQKEWPQLPSFVFGLDHIKVTGLMGMAALNGTPDEASKTFARLRGLRDRWQPLFGAPHALHHLSMGMTGDFEQAILEGATMIRIGSALFEGLPDHAA
ncbi:MAG TPA: YggS family pyridoxal phosphate-dependent enzyme [Gemmatales bacterium]|nr:YggS family pyridoxal phosphate-dependent enzyme [Gemmatales bacterium]